MMKIALNAQSIGFSDGSQRSGTSRYSENLVKALSQIDSVNEYRVFVRPQEKERPLRLGSNFKIVHAKWDTSRPLSRIVWENSVAPSLLRSWKPDIYHCLLNAIPFYRCCPTVVTLLDLAPFRFAQTYRWGQRNYQQLVTRWSASHAQEIVTISEAIRSELIEKFQLDPRRITATGAAVSTFFSARDPQQIVAWRKEKNLPEAFFLFVGNLEPRKNLLQLLRAYAYSKKQGEALPPLMVVGARAWKYAPIVSLLSELGLDDCVHLQGYVPDEELPFWYGAAQCFIYPSLYEGFGLPPLEAMACGCPVLVSQDPALLEVGASAVCSVDPQDTVGFTEALRKIARDTEYRRSLSQKGLERSKAYTWTQVAQNNLQVYRKLHTLTRPNRTQAY